MPSCLHMMSSRRRSVWTIRDRQFLTGTSMRSIVSLQTAEKQTNHTILGGKVPLYAAREARPIPSLGNDRREVITSRSRARRTLILQSLTKRTARFRIAPGSLAMKIRNFIRRPVGGPGSPEQQIALMGRAVADLVIFISNTGVRPDEILRRLPTPNRYV